MKRYFNEDQSEIIDIIGLDNFLNLCNHLQGESVYFPKMQNFKIINRNEKIKKEFNGKNLILLSKKYNICERHIRRILNT